MVGGRGKLPDQPREAGWYPDPWSATGEGERYFDGQRWGTNERPLGRHTTAVIEPTTRERSGSGRDRRTIAGVVIVVALIAGVWWINRSHDAKPHLETLSESTVAPTVPTNRPPPSPEAAKPLGVPAPGPAGAGKFEVKLHQPSAPATPVAFDPCRPIHYVVNVTGAPKDGMALIKSALARVQTATGLHFIDDGTTTEQPSKERASYQPARYGTNRWAPVLIAWQQESTYPGLAGYIAGLGSSFAEYMNANQVAYVSGEVVFDREDLSIAKFPNRRGVRAVMLHELGHLVGLDHTDDRHEIMFSEGEFNVTDYAAGDLRGLAQLGTQQCFPDS
jgi:hypothetical protein